MASSKKLPGSIDEFEATHSLEQLREMAKDRGLSTVGTKRDLVISIFVHHAETYGE